MASSTHAQAEQLGVPVEWHQRRVLTTGDLTLHPDFRGPRIVDVARRVARDGALDARVIGEAVRAGGENPQDLKKVWHLVARHGTPASPLLG